MFTSFLSLQGPGEEPPNVRRPRRGGGPQGEDQRAAGEDLAAGA